MAGILFLKENTHVILKITYWDPLINSRIIMKLMALISKSVFNPKKVKLDPIWSYMILYLILYDTDMIQICIISYSMLLMTVWFLEMQSMAQATFFDMTWWMECWLNMTLTLTLINVMICTPTLNISFSINKTHPS